MSAQYFLNKNIFVRLQQQIMELTSVLTNKLDFLEISRKDVSSLKILLIKMEVRACNKNHMLGVVQENLIIILIIIIIIIIVIIIIIIINVIIFFNNNNFIHRLFTDLKI